MANHPVHARFDGPIVMIGLGSIGRGTLPLLERHIAFDRSKFVAIDPVDTDRRLLDERKLKFMQGRPDQGRITARCSTPLLKAGPGRGMIVNLSVDTSSVDLMDLCKDLDAHYIDTVAEPWPGFYDDPKLDAVAALELLAPRARARPAPPPAGRRHGGELLRRQPRHGVVVRQAGAARHRPRHRRHGRRAEDPRGLGAADAARSASRASTSPSATPSAPGSRSRAARSSTPGRSRASSRRACSRPSSASAPMRRRCRRTAIAMTSAARPAIYLTQPGAGTKVRSWTPTAKAQHGFLVTHNESISIADYFTRARGRQGGLPADLPLRLPSLRRRGAVAARDGGQRLAAAEEVENPRRERDRRRRRRARRAALRPRQERLLVRLTALDRGDAPARALPERHRPAGDLGGARRHRLDAGESGPRHHRGRRDGFPALPGGPAALISARCSAPTPTGRRSTGGPGCFRRNSTSSDPWQFSNVLVR